MGTGHLLSEETPPKHNYIFKQKTVLPPGIFILLDNKTSA